MRADIAENPPPVAVAIEGELDVFSAASVRERLLQALAAGAEVEVNLGKVGEIDGAGVQLLLAAKKEAAASAKRLRITQPSPAVRDVLALCGLADALLDAAPDGGGGAA